MIQTGLINYFFNLPQKLQKSPLIWPKIIFMYQYSVRLENVNKILTAGISWSKLFNNITHWKLFKNVFWSDTCSKTYFSLSVGPELLKLGNFPKIIAVFSQKKAPNCSQAGLRNLGKSNGSPKPVLMEKS